MFHILLHKNQSLVNKIPLARKKSMCKAPITTKLRHLQKLLKASMTNRMIPDQTAPISSGSTLFVSILKSDSNVGNYLQKTTSADDILDVFCRQFKYDPVMIFAKHVSLHF